MGGGGVRRHGPAALSRGLFGLQKRYERLRRENKTVRPVATRYTDYYIPVPWFRTAYVRPRFMPIDYCDINTLIKYLLYAQSLKLCESEKVKNFEGSKCARCIFCSYSVRYYSISSFFNPAYYNNKIYSCNYIKLYLVLMLHRALWNLYTVHSPTNALFIKLGKV